MAKTKKRVPRGPYKKKNVAPKPKPGPRPGPKPGTRKATNGHATAIDLKNFTPIFVSSRRSHSFSGMKLYYSERDGKIDAATLTFGNEVHENKFKQFTIGYGAESELIVVFDEPYFKSQSLELKAKKSETTKHTIVGAVDYCKKIIKEFELKMNKQKKIVAYFRLRPLYENSSKWFALELVDQAETAK